VAKAKDNLIPQAHTLTVEEQSLGGKKSGEARRQKKMLREAFEDLLNKDFKIGKNGETVTGAERLAMEVFKKALNGDLKAFELVRDTAGQKPIEKVVLADIDNDVINEVERMVESGQTTSN
jgi:hypothetical protein